MIRNGASSLPATVPSARSWKTGLRNITRAISSLKGLFHWKNRSSSGTRHPLPSPRPPGRKREPQPFWNPWGGGGRHCLCQGSRRDHLANPLHGWLMNPDDPGSLTHTLQTVLDTPAARINVMGEQCRAFIREYRSPESWLGAFMEIAEQAAGPGSLPEKHTQES